jgi:hypothetical protein
VLTLWLWGADAGPATTLSFFCVCRLLLAFYGLARAQGPKVGGIMVKIETQLNTQTNA